MARVHTKTTSKPTVLPDGIRESDLKFPSYTKCRKVPYDSRSFELWHTTGLGWCIPTLLIARGRTTNRTYATTLDGKPCRIGRGPHVTRTVTVYVTDARLKDLQRFLDLRTKGAGDAGQIRDRISSRRAQGQMERQAGNSYWRWNV
jgi:hypothetical protein